MKVTLLCPQCGHAGEEFSVELVPKNDCVYDLRCPHGHGFSANILYHEFQKLFEVAVNALADHYYRESIGSLTAAYERFIELFIRIALRTNEVNPKTVDGSWKKISRQSERQLGAFICLFASEFDAVAPVLSDDQVGLRNRVIHQGYFPTREECIEYGTAVLTSIRKSIAALHDSEHQDELIRSINDQGNFAPEGPRVTVYAYPLIGTNRPPEEDKKSFEEMLGEATAARKDTNRRPRGFVQQQVPADVSVSGLRPSGRAAAEPGR